MNSNNQDEFKDDLESFVDELNSSSNEFEKHDKIALIVSVAALIVVFVSLLYNIWVL